MFINDRLIMTNILEDKRRAISGACRRHGVVRLDAFGSALRDDFRPDESDVDLLVEFGPMEPYARVDAYFGLLEDLRTLLGPKIDLVMTGADEYPTVDNAIVWAIAERDVPVLRRECAAPIQRITHEEEAD